MWAKLDNNIVSESNDVELHRVVIDNNHDICLKANRKLSALTRVAKFVPFKKRRILFKAFIESQLKFVHLYGCFTEGKSMIR